MNTIKCYAILIYGVHLIFSPSLGVVEILDLKIPKSIESGSVDEVILDCNYASHNEPGLVVKWFYNGQTDQIYQWIPDSLNDTGSPMGSLKHFVHGYAVTNDSVTSYRALKISNLSYELTGSYTCKISGDNSEKFQTKNMTVYVPATEGINLEILEDSSTVVCSAHGVYPEPVIEIYYAGNDTRHNVSLEVPTVTTDSNGFFNKTATLSFDVENATSAIIFKCKLSIPGTDYVLIEEAIYAIEEDEPLLFELEGNEALSNVTNSTIFSNESTTTEEVTEYMEMVIDEIDFINLAIEYDDILNSSQNSTEPIQNATDFMLEFDEYTTIIPDDYLLNATDEDLTNSRENITEIRADIIKGVDGHEKDTDHKPKNRPTVPQDITAEGNGGFTTYLNVYLFNSCLLPMVAMILRY